MDDIIELKKFMIDCLQGEDKLIRRVESYYGNFYESNWHTNLFWEIVEGLEDSEGDSPYEFVERYTEWVDVEHSCEHQILIIKRISDDKLFGVKYENPAHDSYRLFNSPDGFPEPFKPIQTKQVMVTKYTF